MAEFNPDGSIKLPGRLTAQDEINRNIFAAQPSFKILRNQTSAVTPLTCELVIEPSDKIPDPGIIESAFNEAKYNFRNDSGLTITKAGRQYTVKIVSGFNRCSWCHQFIDHLCDRANARIIRTDRCESKFRNQYF